MPTYTYHCENCGNEFDKVQSFSENPLKKCPQCAKLSLFKVYRPAQVVFKGSGYYVTDNKTASSTSRNGKSETSDSNGSTPSAEAKGSDKKSDESSKASPEKKPSQAESNSTKVPDKSSTSQ